MLKPWEETFLPSMHQDVRSYHIFLILLTIIRICQSKPLFLDSKQPIPLPRGAVSNRLKFCFTLVHESGRKKTTSDVILKTQESSEMHGKVRRRPEKHGKERRSTEKHGQACQFMQRSQGNGELRDSGVTFRNFCFWNIQTLSGNLSSFSLW